MWCNRFTSLWTVTHADCMENFANISEPRVIE